MKIVWDIFNPQEFKACANGDAYPNTEVSSKK
jgi:hypothetical protein